MAQFYSRQQHSLEQVAYVREMLKSERLSFKDALFVATEMVCHGFDNAEPFIDSLSQEIGRDDVARFLDRQREKDARLRALPLRAKVLGNEDLVRKLYQPDLQVIVKGRGSAKKLLVVFTTMYNNFGISTALLFAYLMEFGTSIMILKDSSLYNYLRGARAAGDNLDGIVEYIGRTAGEIGASELYFLSFSSGTYAALYAAIEMDARGYLGLSPITDLANSSQLPPPKFFTPEVRADVDPAYLLNLRDVYQASRGKVPATLYYGDDAFVDRAQALNMEGVENVTNIKLEKCAHETVDYLVTADEFRGALAKLLGL